MCREEYAMSEKSCGIDFFAGFLVGALAGAAAALLLAPQAGEETRTLIRDKGIELKEQADGRTVSVRQRTGELRAQAGERAGSLGAQARERAEALQAQLKQAVEEGKSAASKTKTDLLSKIEEGRTGDELVEVEIDE
jgi:gas vesicle protein